MSLRSVARACRRIYWRARLRLSSVHSTFMAGGKSIISKDFVAGPYSYVGPGCLIDPGVSIGAYTMLGPGVKVVGNDHVFDVPGRAIIFSGRPPFRTTSIGADVWIGANAIVKAGVRIGDGAIVAAGAVVTRDVQPLTIVAGIPATFIRRRFLDSSMDELHFNFLQRHPEEGIYCARIGSNRISTE